MRVTDSMITNNVMYNLNSNLYSLNQLYTQTSTGQEIQYPSDDPIGASNVMKYSSYLTRIEQYQENADNAYAWMEITESALDSIEDCVQRLDELTLQASSETNTEEDLEMIRLEVQELMAEIIETSNSDYAGSYIFAGYQTDDEPFEATSTAVGDKLTYNGQYLCLGGPVSTSISDADYLAFYTANSADMLTDADKDKTITYNINANSQVDVNIEGYELFGEDENGLYETLIKLDMFLSGETEYKTIDDSTGTPTVVTQSIDIDEIIDSLDDNLNLLLGLNAETGAKMSYTEININRLTNDEETYTTLLSETQDVDIAEVSVELSEAEYVYEASLSSASKVIMPSLIDFLG